MKFTSVNKKNTQVVQIRFYTDCICTVDDEGLKKKKLFNPESL